MESPASASSSQCAPAIDEPMDAILQAVDDSTAEDPDFHGKLAKNQRRVIESELLDPVQITFNNEAERVRVYTNLLPERFYRTFYETSATLSKYVSVDMHTKHRDRKKLKIEAGVAFQPVAKFTIHDYLHREGIERQLVWNQKVDPSGYISVFNDISHAIRRARFHYDDIHAKCASKICILTKEPGHKEVEKWKMIWRDVDIPVWIHKKARDQYGPTITSDQLKASGADMWTSITEIRGSNLKEEGPFGSVRRDSICAKGHNYEWLSCGPISDSRIVDIWPWDGKRLHTVNSGHQIRSLANSGQPWIWNKVKKMWVPDWVQRSATTHEAQGAGKKREHDNDRDDSRKRSRTCECKKTRSPLSMSTITFKETRPLPLGPGIIA